MTNNLDPYAAPQSHPHEEISFGNLTPPQAVAGMRGAAWISEGYRLFRLSPGNWILLLLVYWFLTMAASMLPLVSFLVTVLQPVFIGGMFYAAYRLEKEGHLAVDDIFAGFRQQFGPLAIVGLITLGSSFVIFGGLFLALLGSVGLELFFGNYDESLFQDMEWQFFAIRIALAVLIGIALYLPVVMAAWFAPVLIMLHQVPPIEAMKMSFLGCLKNIWPFFIYSLVALFWLILAIVPLLLGLLVLFPVLMAGVYCSYKEIFLANNQDNASYPSYA